MENIEGRQEPMPPAGGKVPPLPLVKCQGGKVPPLPLVKCQFCERLLPQNVVKRHERACGYNPDEAHKLVLITVHLTARQLARLDASVRSGDHGCGDRSELIRHALQCYLDFLNTPIKARKLYPTNIALSERHIGHVGSGRTVCPTCGKIVPTRWGCKQCKGM